MQGGGVPISHAVLALLTDGASHGYELKQRFESAIGPQWGDLNIGHLYQVLERLERDGLVARDRVPQADRPDKFAYALTPAGAEELRVWAATPHVRANGYRDELFLKLLGAARLGSEALTTLVAAQRTASLAELSGLVRLRAAHAADPLVSLLVEAAVRHTEADIKVLDVAEERLSPGLPAVAAVTVVTDATTIEAALQPASYGHAAVQAAAHDVPDTSR
jgi:DNA-binding PadR family transcriptional regulator